MTGSREQWIDHLRGVAGAAARPDAHIPAGTLAEPFRHAVIEPASCAAPPELPPDEVRVWWARVDERVDIDAVLFRADDGPILRNDAYRAIEVWTDAELCVMHATWILARERDRRDWQARLERATSWHLEHTQPDNATNRPWALHVFLDDDRPECRHYAETLLHNALAQAGVPEAFSAWILRDCAAALERLA